MTDYNRMAVAARFHVVLRRRLQRVTDVEWMITSRDYARELVRLARKDGDEELREWADKFEVVMQLNRPGKSRSKKSASKETEVTTSSLGESLRRTLGFAAPSFQEPTSRFPRS